MKPRLGDIVQQALVATRPQFRLDLRGGTHGLPHWARVCHHGRTLAKAKAKVMDIDPAVPAWFAFLHDSQRWDDGRDPDHGARAADFAIHLRRAGAIQSLDAVRFKQLCEAMCLHSDGHTPGDSTILVCWDADRLDWCRGGMQPDPARLRTSAARQPQVIASALQIFLRLRSTAEVPV